MQHAITVKDVLEWSGITIGIIGVLGLIIGVLAVVAGGFKD